jgi:hypothetical protein
MLSIGNIGNTYVAKSYIPISGGTEESKLFERDIARNEFADGVTWKYIRNFRKSCKQQSFTDEEIRQLDVIPEIFPDLFLGRPWNVDKITADFYVRAVDNGKFGPDLLDKRNETRHLRVI